MERKLKWYARIDAGALKEYITTTERNAHSIAMMLVIYH